MDLRNIKSKKILYVFEYFPPYQMGGAEISGKIRLEKLSKNNKIIALTPNYDRFKLEKIKRDYLLIKYPCFRYFLYKKRKQVSHKILKKSKSRFFTLLLIFNILSGLEMKFWIWRIGKKFGGFDILHGNNIESDIGVGFSNIKSVKIAHLRDTIVFDDIYKKNILQKILNDQLIKFIRRLLVRKIDRFVAISEFMKLKCARILKINPEKITVVYNDVSKDQVCELSKQQARKKLGLSRNKKYVLFVGSLTKKKGVDILAEKIAPEIKNVDFLIAGTGPLEEELKQNISSNVKLRGFVENKEIKYYYKAADIVVVPSVWQEPWGRVSAEAQANNTFTIVNDVGGLPETIKKGKGKVVKNENLAGYLKKFFKIR